MKEKKASLGEEERGDDKKEQQKNILLLGIFCQQKPLVHYIFHTLLQPWFFQFIFHDFFTVNQMLQKCVL